MNLASNINDSLPNARNSLADALGFFSYDGVPNMLPGVLGPLADSTVSSSDQMQSEVNALRNRITSLEAEIYSMEDERDELRTRVASLESELSNMRELVESRR
jgi:FtsZ-binding cell division protein ZapB